MNARAIFLTRDGEWRTLWRIVAMFVLVIAVVFVVNFGWRAVGLPGQRDSTPWHFMLLAILITGGVTAVLVFLLRLFERRGPDAIGLPFSLQAVLPTLIGTALGAVPILLIVIAAVIGGYGKVSVGTLSLGMLPTVLLPMLIAGFLFAAWEELVLRGYLLRQLSIGLNPAAAVVITGVLFGLLHSGNPGANWEGLVYTAIGGILMGWLMVRSGSLWLLIGYHFGWNATAYQLFGLELSGLDADASFLIATLDGSEWLTGGSYGFEASLPAVIAETVVLLAVLRFRLFPARSSALAFGPDAPGARR
ncbi:MAG: CPBP family intramembrane metalloprotease [Woeseiaceae bacterium]|nr:CPBP family intramembrane metalloprotease [Woeseiaceae bacterium]